jgi:hypothetical protein
MTLLAKSTIRPEDAQNPIRHLGLERGFPPSIAVQTAASEFANSVNNVLTRIRSGPALRAQTGAGTAADDWEQLQLVATQLCIGGPVQLTS